MIDGLSAREFAGAEGVSVEAIRTRINALATKAPEFYRWWRAQDLSDRRRRRSKCHSTMSLTPFLRRESTNLLGKTTEHQELAGRQGVSAGAFKNLNEDRPFQRNSHKAKDLPFSDSFVGFRPFAAVFGFFRRNDT
jgi:hypothetical protein